METILIWTVGPIAAVVFGTIIYCAVAVGFEVARVGLFILEERIGLAGVLLLGVALAFAVGIAISA
ncbi:MAG: hypothetical protein ACKO2Y_06475 [Actinomycetota bacterium]